MQFSLAFVVTVLAASASAATLDHGVSLNGNALVPRACGAAGSCHGLGGGDLCNDRCKRCSGPTGRYKRGDCCGFGWQACCCYYS